MCIAYLPADNPSSVCEVPLVIAEPPSYTLSISEIAIYHTALSASQVRTIYNGREPYNHKEGIATGNLKGWWRMGDGLERHSGTTIYDMSNNTNNGTMTNMDAVDFVGDTP